MSAVAPREKRLAEAVAILMEVIHHDVPTASTRPLAPYDDEALTLEVRMPAGMAWDTVRDACLRHALAIEDLVGFFIFTRVKVAARPPASRVNWPSHAPWLPGKCFSWQPWRGTSMKTWCLPAVMVLQGDPEARDPYFGNLVSEKHLSGSRLSGISLQA